MNCLPALPPRQAPTVAASAVVLTLLIAAVLGANPAHAAAVFLDDMTSPELQQRIAAGATTVLVPIGGTEQSGPQLALGKHNVRARLLAARIAERLGNAVVAPVIAYVPEGSIRPPTEHMRWAGTISVPESAFEAVLEGAARSFRQHGFRHVFFLGDHGGYQKSEERVAAKLDREWAGDPGCRVYALTAYYRAAQAPFTDELKRRGYGSAEIGSHAGLADTSLSLALDPASVRSELLGHANVAGNGVNGDPRRASAELGEIGVQKIVESSVEAIRALTTIPATPPTRRAP